MGESDTGALLVGGCLKPVLPRVNGRPFHNVHSFLLAFVDETHRPAHRSALQTISIRAPSAKSFNGKPQATVFPAIADAFGLPSNDFGCGFAGPGNYDIRYVSYG